jgi:hypothetical protein
VTPVAAVEVAGSPAELLIDVAPADDGRLVAALERYDGMLSGWGRSGLSVALICGDEAGVQRCCAIADTTLTASHAYAGEHPREWPRPGRERICFVVERDLHEGSLRAWRAPALPPAVRGEGEADGRVECELAVPDIGRGDCAAVRWS